jgi:hypothetical protein
MKTILYPLTFWLSDYQLYIEECRLASDEDSILEFPRLFQRFLKDIPDSDAAHHRCVRMFYAMAFFNENLDAIERAHGAVWSEEKIMIKSEVIIALHKLFAGIPDNVLNERVQIADFLEELKNVIKNKEISN